jgi:type IV secretory pathway TrbF-like protein
MALFLAFLVLTATVVSMITLVAIDSLGRSIASGSAEQATAADDRLRRATILSWVENLRTDALAQRKAIDSVYAHIASGSQAQTFVSEFYRGNPPQKRNSVCRDQLRASEQ